MYLLFDIGGTRARLAISNSGKEFEEPLVFKTPTSFEQGMRHIISAAETLLHGKRLLGIAGGIRGVLAHDHSGISHDSVLTDWVNKPLTATLKDAFCVPVYLENDAALGALGEAHSGSGKDARIVAYHTVSTGFGGARVVNGVLDAAHTGFEPGKQHIDVDHTLYPEFSKKGTLEELISGEAVEKRSGKKPYDIPQDDPTWDELALYLAHGLSNTIAYWSPDVIVLGGSMILGNPRILLQNIKSHTEKLLDGLPLPPIVDGKLGDLCGLYGAMVLQTHKTAL